MSIATPNPLAPPARRAPAPGARSGVVYGLSAYLAWGLAPLYFKKLQGVPALEIVVWSVVFLAALLALRGDWRELKEAVRRRRTLLTLACSTGLIASNWFLFIWAVTHGHMLQASLGYFINPLVSILLAVVFLRERLRPGQAAGLLLATAGVLNLAARHGQVPWVAIALAVSFAVYGLLRKTAAAGSLVGLSVETALLLPIALPLVAGWLPAGGAGDVPFSTGTYALLTLAGPVTVIPLLCFAAGARLLRLSTMGFLQYVSPTCHFLLAVLVFREPFSGAQLASFSLIWLALAVYTIDSLRGLRRAAAGRGAEDRPAGPVSASVALADPQLRAAHLPS